MVERAELEGLVTTLGFFKKYLTEFVLLIGILLVFGITALFNDSYILRFHYNATTLILQPAAILGIFALGAAVVIISGGIDLSSGSMIALGASIVCLTMLIFSTLLHPDLSDPTSSIPIWLIVVAIVITIGIAFLIGTLHTWLITVIQLPPFVATLASLVGLRSLALIMNKAITKQLGNQQVKVNIQDEKFFALANEWWVPVAIFVVLAIALHIVMNYTVLGRHLYAMGGNEEAAKLSGIRTDRLKWFAYSFAAITAAIAGILGASQIQQSDPAGQGLGDELFAIAAAVIGGCSLAGGVGRVSGVVLGALFLRVVIDSVAKIIRAGSDDYEGLIVGFLVVLAVAFNEVTGSKSGWRKQFFPGVLGIISLLTIALLIGVVIAFSVKLSPDDANAWKVGIGVALVTAVLLGVIRIVSSILGKRKESI